MPNLRLCLSIRSSALYEVNDRAPSMYAMHIYDELETRKTNKKGDFFFHKFFEFFLQEMRTNICSYHQSNFWPSLFKKELHLPSPFAKTGELFWPDFPRFRFFIYQGKNRGFWFGRKFKLGKNFELWLRFSISHEKREIKEFYDKKYLTRKTGKKNEKLK